MKPTYESVIQKLPVPWPEDLMPAIRRALARSDRALVVLDDDPTGTQTVHDLPVLTEWSVDALGREFSAGTPVFYVLTNSRSLNAAQANQIAVEAGNNLRLASAKTGRSFSVISRSDSTLRGHFPLEVDSLLKTLNAGSAVRIIIPFFLEGGRLTVDDTHYVREGDNLIPAADTPFAQDAVFGYQHSDLKEWVEEKSGGGTPAVETHSLDLYDIRRGGPLRVSELLSCCPPGSTCIVNCLSYRDLEVVTLGLLKAEKRDFHFLCRTAASYVRVRAGLETRPLLTRDKLDLPEQGGGLTVVGSHVPRTTRQLNRLLELPQLDTLELPVTDLLSSSTRPRVIRRLERQLTSSLRSGQDVVIYTSRDLITGATPAESLAIANQVSDGLVEIIKYCTERPRYLIAKGGITSSDLATQAFQATRAWVMGQILPGVPVWRFGPESRIPGLAYIVFPGNVGTDTGLLDTVNGLRGRDSGNECGSCSGKVAGG